MYGHMDTLHIDALE